MVNGYSGPIIRSLQTKLGMSRGALYRHYKSKDDLFKVVIDTYFFQTLERLTDHIDPNVKVPELVRSMHKRQRLVSKLITTKGGSQFTFLNFNNLLINAARYYPGFGMRYKKIQLHVDTQWRIALNNSMAAGEIRKDVDVNLISRLFTKIYFMDTREDFPVKPNGLPNTKSNIDGQDQFVLAIYELMKE